MPSFTKKPAEYIHVDELFIIRAIEVKLEEYGRIIDGSPPIVYISGINQRIFRFPVMGKFQVIVRELTDD